MGTPSPPTPVQYGRTPPSHDPSTSNSLMKTETQFWPLNSRLLEESYRNLTKWPPARRLFFCLLIFVFSFFTSEIHWRKYEENSIYYRNFPQGFFSSPASLSWLCPRDIWATFRVINSLFLLPPSVVAGCPVTQNLLQVFLVIPESNLLNSLDSVVLSKGTCYCPQGLSLCQRPFTRIPTQTHYNN